MSSEAQWEPIDTAQHVANGTVADLKMENGRVYRASWSERGRTTAWWPLTGNRKLPIGLYDPLEWRRVHDVAALPSVQPPRRLR